MDEKVFGNGIFDQIKPNYIEVSYNIKEQLEFIKYIENLMYNTLSIPKNRIK
jgi:hypothetical protein